MENKRNFNINDYKTQTVKYFTFKARKANDFRGKEVKEITVTANSIEEAAKKLGRVDREDGKRSATYIPVEFVKVVAVLEGVKKSDWSKMCTILESTDITDSFTE